MPTRGERPTGRDLARRDGKILNSWMLETFGGQVQMIRAVLNPDKLGHLGPVAEGWAIFREAIGTPRPGR